MTGRRSPRHDTSLPDGGLALPRQGRGEAYAHHGELIQGVFQDDRGRLRRGLLTLPLGNLASAATFLLADRPDIGVFPPDRTKAANAAGLALRQLGRSDLGGALAVQSAIPVGHGYGSSTADVIAAIRAVADVFDTTLRPSVISRLAVEAEGASDAVAYQDQAVLFAQREGIVIEHFGDALPPLVLVGFKANDGQPVDTLLLPPARYSGEEIQTFAMLRGMAARAVRYQDPRLLGQAATLSARISQRHLAKAQFSAALKIASDFNACGVQVAHSGSLIGILLDAEESGILETAQRISEAAASAGLTDVVVHSCQAVEGSDDH